MSPLFETPPPLGGGALLLGQCRCRRSECNRLGVQKREKKRKYHVWNQRVDLGQENGHLPLFELFFGSDQGELA